jgi:ataxia telangiectasia mutated family protein
LGTSERTASDYRNNVGDAKSSAAAELMTALERKGTAYVTQLVQSYQVLTDAYMHLAMASTTEFHQGARAKKPILISQVCGPKQRLDNCLRSGPKSLPHCPPCVLTKPPPLRPGCDYGEGREDPIGAERIDRFENSFTITETGINRPKVVMCIGSKGGKFRQLVKGQDDIRQDAIMQQVFKYVNDLMTDREKKGCLKPSKMLQNKLKLVTYHIVPLSPITGVSLQSRWVSLNLNILPI